MTGTLLTSRDLAQRWDVSQKTILSWIKGGRLRATATPTGQARIAFEDATAFATKQGLPSFGRAAQVLAVGAKSPRALRALLPERKLLHWEPEPYMALARLVRTPIRAVVVASDVADLPAYVSALRHLLPAAPIAALIGKRRIRRGLLLEAGASAVFSDAERDPLAAWVRELLEYLL